MAGLTSPARPRTWRAVVFGLAAVYFLVPLIASVRRHTTLPVVVGFGISMPQHLAALEGKADGVIVASALLDAIGQSPENPARQVREFLAGLRPPP